jgi:L-amino acid N-acyltransferase YncA
MMTTFALDLAPRPLESRTGIRPVTVADWQALESAFLEAFAWAPEYANYPAKLFRKTGAEYLERFFGNDRGEWSPVSVLAEVGKHIVGAALVKCGDKGYLLDCLYVVPACGRRGWATALTCEVVHELLAQGVQHLRSHVHLANEPSLAWHESFGFQEVPDLWVAEYRWRMCDRELGRQRRLKLGTQSEQERLAAQVDRLHAEVVRLQELKKYDLKAAYADLD